MTDTIHSHDSLDRRCPKLGHAVQFSYCREPGNNIPCQRIFDCWWETFDIESFVKQWYEPEILAQLHEPPKSKMFSLIELIQQAQKRKQQSKNE